MKLEAAWLSTPEVKALDAAFRAGGYELRFVGGCVRDTLLGGDPSELDAATDAPPETTMALLEKAGLRAVPTGLKHGTITAIVNHKSFEITTLRSDVATDGRHAEVSFTTAWEEDAARRDFTMNALYVATDGTLYDPVGGIADCKARRVVFIGEAENRIREDYLRILRYFRFAASVGNNVFDDKALAACAAEKAGINQLSGERISAELLKMMQVPVAAALQKMNELSVLSECLPIAHFNVQAVAKLDDIQAQPLLKLAGLVTEAQHVVEVASRLKLSGKQTGALALWLLHANAVTPGMGMHAQQKLVRKLGGDYTPVVQLAYALSDKNWGAYAPLLDMQDWPVPQFPVAAKDLMDRGAVAGKELGDTLRKLETLWEDSGYTLTREALLSKA